MISSTIYDHPLFIKWSSFRHIVQLSSVLESVWVAFVFMPTNGIALMCAEGLLGILNCLFCPVFNRWVAKKLGPGAKSFSKIDEVLMDIEEEGFSCQLVLLLMFIRLELSYSLSVSARSCFNNFRFALVEVLLVPANSPLVLVVCSWVLVG